MEDEGLSINWHIVLEAVCHGNKPYYQGPPRPGPPTLVYKDQGVAWELTVEYEYYETE
jgi:hypothetical protein